MRHIQRFVVEEQEAQDDRSVLEGSEKGIERGDGEADDVGWDDRRVCEYRQTGHL